MLSSQAVGKVARVAPIPKSFTWVPSLTVGVVLVSEEILEHLLDLSWQQSGLLHAVTIAVLMATAGILPGLVWKRGPGFREASRGSEEILAAGRRFQALVEHGSGGAALFDATGVLLYASPAVGRMLGYRPEDLAGRTVLHLLHPEDKARAPVMLADLLARPSGWLSGALRVRHQDGAWRWLGVVVMNLLDDPAVGALLCHYRDITERKQAEEIASRGQTHEAPAGRAPLASGELEAHVQQHTTERAQVGRALTAEAVERRRAEAALQSLFDGVPVGLFRTTRGGEILDANPALARMLGWADQASLLGANVGAFYANPADRERWLAHVERDGAVRGFEVRLRRRDGESTWVRLSGRVVRDPDGHVRHYEGMVEDITERTRDAEELRKLSSAVEQTADAVCITNREGIIEYVNPAFERLSGYSLQEVRGQTPRILKSGRHEAEFYAGLWRTILAGNVLRCEVVNRRKDGSLYDSELAITPIRDATGQITHFVATQRDTTERTATQDRLRESEAQLRAFATRLEAVREEERARIAREIHDELGQAMTSLKIDLAWLARRLDGGSQALLTGKVDSMLALIDSTIRSVRRIATELRPGVLDDFGLVAAMEWQAQEFEARTGITCVFEADASDPRLRPEQSIAVFRIMQEALTNVARHAAATRVTIAFRREAEMLSLTVQDNGRGIRQQDICSRKSLGLLGMRERANLLGGRVDIAGSPGGGTRVTVTIPWQDSATARP